MGGARAEAAVSGAALAAPLRGVVEGLGTGGHTLAFIQVTLHPKLIYGTKKANLDVKIALNFVFCPAANKQHDPAAGIF